METTSNKRRSSLRISNKTKVKTEENSSECDHPSNQECSHDNVEKDTSATLIPKEDKKTAAPVFNFSSKSSRKRRKGKPSKSAPNECNESDKRLLSGSDVPSFKAASDNDCSKKKNFVPGNSYKANGLNNIRGNSICATSLNFVQNEKSTQENASDSSNKEPPVYTALEHAATCLSNKDCTVPKCYMAKEFLAHRCVCLKQDSCNTCKAMDIMVGKHAKNCTKQFCPVPNCDQFRYATLEEKSKVKQTGEDMLLRAFQGLIHARACQDSRCDLVLCKNIKTILLHTQSCQHMEHCKAKKFIIQLCEHHERTCTDEYCQVEFCQENRKRISIALEQQLRDQNLSKDKEAWKWPNGSNERAYSYCTNTIYNKIPSSQVQNYGVVTGEKSYNADATTQHDIQQLMYQSDFMGYSIPYMTFPLYNQFPSSISKPYLANNLKENASTFSMSDNLEKMASRSDFVWPNEAIINHYHTEGDDTKVHLPQSQDLNQISAIQHLTSDSSYISPNSNVHFQMCQNKAALPRLSSEELQSILMPKDGDGQWLSPVQDNRANYSAVPVWAQEYPAQSFHESELNENLLLGGEKGQFEYKKYEKRNEKCQLYKMEKSLKSQAEWSQIDFVRQRNLQLGLEEDTETADETDSDLCSEYGLQEDSYFVAKCGKHVESSRHSKNVPKRTDLEMRYLATLDAQK